MKPVNRSGWHRAGTCMLVVSFALAWSCAEPAEDTTGTIDDDQSPEFEGALGLHHEDSVGVRGALGEAPDTVWVIARASGEDGNSLYYGSFFLHPDGTVEASFESSGTSIALLNTQFLDDMLVLYYSLSYQHAHRIQQDAGGGTPEPTEVFRVQVTSEQILRSLPANGGSLSVTVRPSVVSPDDVPRP